MKIYFPNIYALSFDITYNCSLECINCLKICNFIKDPDIITVDQVVKMLDESIKYNYKWERISINGGEPTLHPQFEEIIKLLNNYKNKREEINIRVYSNGFTDITKSKLKWLIKNYPKIGIVNSHKRGSYRKHHWSITNAPMDYNPEKKIYYGCNHPRSCGICFNFAGFYYCATSAAIDRIFGFNVGIKSIKDLSAEIFCKYFNLFCSKCGELDFKKFEKVQTISSTWKKALNEFNGTKLTRY